MIDTIEISITDLAKAHIRDMLKKKEQPSYFRLAIKKTGCNGYMYVPEIVAVVSKGDEIISNMPFDMIIPSSSKELLHGTRIDFVTKQFGMKQLVFVHPNAAGVCGCGESFNFKKSEADE